MNALRISTLSLLALTACAADSGGSSAIGISTAIAGSSGSGGSTAGVGGGSSSAGSAAGGMTAGSGAGGGGTGGAGGGAGAAPGGGSAGSAAGAPPSGGNGGAGGSKPTVVDEYFGSDEPETVACANCLRAMTGKAPSDPLLDCSKVVAACGSTGCDQTMSCLVDDITANNYTLSYDCAVNACKAVIAVDSKGEDFVVCMAEKCGQKCAFTPGFKTTVCK